MLLTLVSRVQQSRLFASREATSLLRRLLVFDRFSLSITMNNAVQLWDGHLSVITRPVPHVQNSQDVVVKITYSGVCGTDLKILEGKFPCEKSVILGHEFVGVIKEAGSEVKHVSVGDR